MERQRGRHNEVRKVKRRHDGAVVPGGCTRRGRAGHGRGERGWCCAGQGGAWAPDVASSWWLIGCKHAVMPPAPLGCAPMCAASSARMGTMVAVTKDPYRMEGMRIQFLRAGEARNRRGRRSAMCGVCISDL